MSRRSILVTGAAGGIGAAASIELASLGYYIVAADLDAQACAPIIERIRAAGGEGLAVGLDIRDAASVEVAVERAADAGAFVALVNCAGVVHLGEIEDTSAEEWSRVIEINLTGTFLACQAAVPRLSAKEAAIVNLASTAGRTASTYSSPAYVASKAGVVGLTMSLARQLAPRGIRVNAVAPGIIDTPMISSYGQERQEALVAGIPFGRMGSSEEVATTIAYLATDRSSYVTGQTIAINGGTFIS